MQRLGELRTASQLAQEEAARGSTAPHPAGDDASPPPDPATPAA